MTVQTSSQQNRHLTPVPDLPDFYTAAQSALASIDEIFRLTAGLATGVPMPAPIPAAVIDRLEELDALHETACDVYDMATAALEAARTALTEAAARLTGCRELQAMRSVTCREGRQQRSRLPIRRS
jgi:hypothetical protein